jgi:hypothetical protein
MKMTKPAQIDPRIKLLSYSALLTLHSCPRKFELNRLKAVQDELDPTAACNQNVTFAFGHVVGDGMQQVLAGLTEDQIIWKMFCDWHADLADENPKQAKSFYLAVIAVQRFIALREAGLLEDWELLIYKGKPAVELAFRILFPDGFTMRGSLDAVLKHKVTSEIMVFEGKTSSSSTLNPTTYKNSSQGVGYSVILDVIAPDISSYKVLYMVYLTKQQTFEMLEFPKTYLQRATWIQELLLDVETIKLYEEHEVYPTRGESCSDWGRDCEYLSTCTLNNKYVTQPFAEGSVLDDKVYDVELTLLDLLDSQFSKNTDSINDIDSINVDAIADELIATIEGEAL